MSHWHLVLSVSKLHLISSPTHLLFFFFLPLEAWALLSHQCQKPNTCDSTGEARFPYKFNVYSRNDWESGLLLTEKHPGKQHYIQVGRCWDCGHVDFKVLAGIQVEISSSQLEMTLYMTDCWSWLEKWKLKSFFEKFKLWFDRNHTVSKSENTQKHSAVEDGPQRGREREEHWGEEGVAFGVCFLAN